VLTVDDQLCIPLRELHFEFARSGGPGGQNVNKTSTKAVLHWDVAGSPGLPDGVRQRFLERYKRRVTHSGVLVLSSTRFRNRGRNVADCIEKLRSMLAEVATPPKKRRPTRPKPAAKERRLEGKRRTSAAKSRRRRPDPDDS
jgi:ribosome-associated protein